MEACRQLRKDVGFGFALPNLNDYLQELYWRPIIFDEGNDYPGTRTVRLNDDLLSSNGLLYVIDFKGNVGHGFHHVWIWGILLISGPFNAVWILTIATHIHFQMF
jgi:hypothetical protein